MINDGCSYTNSKILIKGVGENLLPTAHARRLRRPGLSVAAPCTRASHDHLFCHLTPGQALITKLQDLLGGRRMSGRSAATHGDADAPKLLADCGRGNAQLVTDLAQRPTLDIQIGCTLNVHRATVMSLSRIAFPLSRHTVSNPEARDESGQDACEVVDHQPGHYRGASPNLRKTSARFSANRRVLGWSSPSTRRDRARVSSSRVRASSYSPNADRSRARLLAELRVLG